MNKKYWLLGAVIVIVLLIIVTVLAIFIPSDEKSVIIVNTKSGAVKGIEIESDNASFIAFFSIPYAKPPINTLRFKTTESIEPWSTIHDGSTEGPFCPQFTATNEDCLTLTVYTNDPDVKGKSVYVYIHGGALRVGGAIISLIGPHYFMQHDIVVVVVQFRLGMLGFLNLNMVEAPGNMGLADVIEALKWIQQNIEYFGGDPNQVTLGGHSSGGIMTHALLLSPQTEGLFQKVLIQSGTALSYRFFNGDVESIKNEIKMDLDMGNSTDIELLEHLNALTVAELLTLERNLRNLHPSGYAEYFPFSMSLDHLGVLPKKPLELIRDNNYRNLPMLIGLTSDEGIRLETSLDSINFLNENFYLVVPTDMYPIFDKSSDKNATAQIIKDFYFGSANVSIETFPELAKLCTDSWYGHITDYLVRLQAHLNYSAPVYYYIFALDGAFNEEKISSNINSPGPTHGDENGYLWNTSFGQTLVPYDNDDYSALARERMVAMWANFIKTSDPIPETNELFPIRWPTLNYPSVNYLLINRTLSIDRQPFRERLLFWQGLYGFDQI